MYESYIAREEVQSIYGGRSGSTGLSVAGTVA